MNKILLSILFAALSSTALAEAPKYEWTTFQSDYGYEVKHPTCWIPEINNPDETGEMKQVKHLFIKEGPTCTTPQRYKFFPNGIGIDISSAASNSLEEMKKKIEGREKFLSTEFKNKKSVFYKKTKIGEDEAIIYVEQFSKFNPYIRWNMEIFCNHQWIKISSPSIGDPSPSYFEKFKAGDFGLPEPERTIYESIRCINPKSKPGK